MKTMMAEKTEKREHKLITFGYLFVTSILFLTSSLVATSFVLAEFRTFPVLPLTEFENKLGAYTGGIVETADGKIFLVSGDKKSAYQLLPLKTEPMPSSGAEQVETNLGREQSQEQEIATEFQEGTKEYYRSLKGQPVTVFGILSLASDNEENGIGVRYDDPVLGSTGANTNASPLPKLLVRLVIPGDFQVSVQ